MRLLAAPRTPFPTTKYRKAGYFSDLYMLNEETMLHNNCSLLNLEKSVGITGMLTAAFPPLEFKPQNLLLYKILTSPQQVLEPRYGSVRLLSFCPFSDFLYFF